ncbi:hypothetical protein KIPB_003545 [Kipferlia bialata]|uniref:Uncharacterized protein n=1 Tax=Kipferlia bialata TaxID=797122 RepID=A0A9K3CVL5_9EUKA|nr:hypothetical protein KIPB_003545 [Kipferlia bialata]|eukprot:g3545.t1
MASLSLTPDGVGLYACQWHHRLGLDTLQVEGHAVRYSLAGGAFKCLMKGRDNDTSDLSLPRDLDLWPHDEGSRAALNAHFERDTRFTKVRVNQFHTCFKMNIDPSPSACGAQIRPGSVDIEVVHKIHTSVEDVCSGFDLVISCVGVQFGGGGKGATPPSPPHSVYMHPSLPHDILSNTVSLVMPMPNRPFMLVSYNRVIKYARDLRYMSNDSTPAEDPSVKASLAHIRSIYQRSSEEERATYLSNYAWVVGDNLESVGRMSELTSTWV